MDHGGGGVAEIATGAEESSDPPDSSFAGTGSQTEPAWESGCTQFD